MRTANVVSICAGLACLVTWSTSRASEDAGVRSALAYGAGIRALSMGGAYVAVADDATATIWNPAGLSQVQRNELQASHASLYGLGFSENHGFLALPSWRYGVAALAFRHLGVGGIELRDEFNVVQDEDLSRNETEIALGYGHRLGRAWSLGLTAKVQDLRFAGYSGQGLGIDLGILGEPLVALGIGGAWSRRVRAGLAVRNLLEPSINLDQESVPDPTGLRVGTSIVFPLAGGRYVNLALDLEKTQRMDARVHLGMELRLHSLFAVRAGLRDGVITAGTGVAWRDVAVDYVFENGDFETVQRVGLSLRFGATTAMRRQAALEAEERALQDRLDAAYTQRQAQRVEELVEEGRLALDRGDPTSALQAFDAAEALDPENMTYRSLRADAEFALGAAFEAQGSWLEASMHYAQAVDIDPSHAQAEQAGVRCRQQIELLTTRSQEIRARFATALDAFINGDLLTAREGFSQVVDTDPADREAKSMLDRTQRAIDQQVDQWLELAAEYADAGRLDKSGSFLRLAEELDADAPGLAAARARLEAARDTARAASRTAPEDPLDTSPVIETTAVLSSDELREIEDLYRSGIAAVDAGRVDEAVHYWELVFTRAPDYQQVRSHLKREYVLRGMQLFANREVRQAIDQWEHALRVDPTDERTISYLQRARTQLARTEEIRNQGR